MNRYLLVLALLLSNTYANKNWIEFDSNNKDKIQNSNDLKMFDSNSSFDNLNNQSGEPKKRSADRDLIELFNQVQNMTQKIQSKIKK